MGFPRREIVDIVDIIYYVPALAAAVFVLVKHGFKRQLGWIYLAILSLLRIIGSSAGIAWEHDKTNENLLATFIICFTIGLSPLILCLIGMTTRVQSSMSSPPIPPRFMRILQLPVIAGLVLGILGGTNQFSSNPSDVSNGHTYLKAAVLIFLGVLVGLSGVVILSMLQIGRVPESEKKLVLAGVCSLPFLFVRIIYSVVAAFDYKSPNFQITSEKQEAVVLQAILGALMEFIVVTMYITAGFLTPPTPKDNTNETYQTPMRRGFGRRRQNYGQQQEVV